MVRGIRMGRRLPVLRFVNSSLNSNKLTSTTQVSEIGNPFIFTSPIYIFDSEGPD